MEFTKLMVCESYLGAGYTAREIFRHNGLHCQVSVHVLYQFCFHFEQRIPQCFVRVLSEQVSEWYGLKEKGEGGCTDLFSLRVQV